MMTPRDLSGEEMKRAAAAADRALGAKLDRLRIYDDEFRAILDRLPIRFSPMTTTGRCA
jgi:hypothetical protein